VGDEALRDPPWLPQKFPYHKWILHKEGRTSDVQHKFPLMASNLFVDNIDLNVSYTVNKHSAYDVNI